MIVTGILPIKGRMPGNISHLAYYEKVYLKKYSKTCDYLSLLILLYAGDLTISCSRNEAFLNAR